MVPSLTMRTRLSGRVPYSSIRSNVASGGMPLKNSTAAVTAVAMTPAARTAAKDSASMADSRWNSQKAAAEPASAPSAAATGSIRDRSRNHAVSRPAATDSTRAVGTTSVLCRTVPSSRAPSAPARRSRGTMGPDQATKAKAATTPMISAAHHSSAVSRAMVSTTPRAIATPAAAGAGRVLAGRGILLMRRPRFRFGRHRCRLPCSGRPGAVRRRSWPSPAVRV